MEFNKLTISQAHDLLTKGEVAVKDLVQASLKRIKGTSELNAFITVLEEQALAQAEELDELLSKQDVLPPLFGIPAGIKDVLMTQGIRTTAGSRILADYQGVYDATAVAKVRQQAVIVGKNNCDEFAMGASGEHSAFGPTKNPWDKGRVPGGSSSGSAAAVASGSVLFSLGTDTGGSIRQPAAFCGIVGLKPTYGLVSRFGLIAMASSFDVIGPLAKTIEDAAWVLSVIAGRDEKDATSVDSQGRYIAAVKKPLASLRIGLPKQYFTKGLDPEIAQIIKARVDQLAKEGLEVKEVDLPSLDYALAVYYIIVPAEVSSNLAKFDGLRYGRRFTEEVDDIIDYYLQARGTGFGPEAKRRILLGTFILSAGYIDKYYLQAQKVRTKIIADFERVFEEVDVLISPTTPTLPFKLGEKELDPLQMYLSDVYTVAVNIAGLPALSVPVGISQNLPVGMQIIGPRFSEEKILALGRMVEDLRGPWQLPTN